MDLSNIVRSDAKLDTRQKASIALRLYAPAMMAQISSIAMQYIDAAMVGRLGADASASIGLVAAIVWLMGGVTFADDSGFFQMEARVVARHLYLAGHTLADIHYYHASLRSLGQQAVEPWTLRGIAASVASHYYTL